jgi:hypothetical protein
MVHQCRPWLGHATERDAAMPDDCLAFGALEYARRGVHLVAESILALFDAKDQSRRLFEELHPLVTGSPAIET